MADDLEKYLFDTSSLNRIWKQADSNAAWDTVIGLIEGGQGFTVPEVMDELHKVNPATYERINAHRQALILRRTPARYTSAAIIRSNYRSMAKATKPHDSADAWVVGVAKEGGFTVVTNENPKGRGQKMPKVCDKEGISWLSLEDLIKKEGPQ